MGKLIPDFRGAGRHVAYESLGLSGDIVERPTYARTQGGREAVAAVDAVKKRTAKGRTYGPCLRLNAAKTARDVSDIRFSLRGVSVNVDSAAAQTAEAARHVTDIRLSPRGVGLNVDAICQTAGLIHGSSLPSSVFFVPLILPKETGLFSFCEVVQVHRLQLRVTDAAHAKDKPPQALIIPRPSFRIFRIYFAPQESSRSRAPVRSVSRGHPARRSISDRLWLPQPER